MSSAPPPENGWPASQSREPTSQARRRGPRMRPDLGSSSRALPSAGGPKVEKRGGTLMKARWLAATAAAMVLSAGPALAQKVPENASEVARPGGTIAGGQKVALVKVADGFNDPVGVSVANDGSGRIFVVERVGRVKVVKGGKANAEPFLDLTNINPLGSDVQTGFVEQGLWSIAFHPKFKENGHFFVHYASLPFNGASLVVRFTVDP